MSTIESVVQSVIEPLQAAKAQLLNQREEYEKTFRQIRKEHQKNVNLILDNVRNIDKMLAAAGVKTKTTSTGKPSRPKYASSETVEKVFAAIQELQLYPQQGPITRKKLSTHAHLHSTSVTNALTKLVDDGRVAQVGTYQGKQGPPQATYAIVKK